MASFRLYSKTRTWFGSTGQLLAGGYLRFYAANSTTPQNVYGEAALTTNNGSQVDLDASGRLVNDCWANTSASYFVEVYNSAGVKQGEEDNVEVPGGSGQAIPIPEPGYFVTGDGAQFLTAEIRQVPDPTGHSNKVLATPDGIALSWIAKPADGAAGVSDTATTATSIRVGNRLIQWGSGTAPASATEITTAEITFPTPFSAAPYLVVPQVATGPTVNGHALVADGITGLSASGCTVNFNVADRHYVDGSKLINSIPFTWVAVGPV